MTDIEQALAEALHLRHLGGTCESLTGCPRRADFLSDARYLADTEPMQAIARDAAVGRAVREAEETWVWSCEYDRRGGYHVWLAPKFNGSPKRQGRGPTIDAAIAAALGDDDDA